MDTGKISLLDAAVHDFLCLTADYRTGVARVSAEKIRALCPSDITLRAIQRSLAPLEGIGWIKRFRTHGQRGNYPVAIAKFRVVSVTDGVTDKSSKWMSVNLERTTDWRNVQFDDVTDVSPSGEVMCHSPVTVRGTDVSPVKEVRSDTGESREKPDPESESESVSQEESLARSFDGFDLPKDRKLRISRDLASSLFIDCERLNEEERAALMKLVPHWQRSLKDIESGVVSLSAWIREAIEQMKGSKITYLRILERRMHELEDGRLSVQMQVGA